MKSKLILKPNSTHRVQIHNFELGLSGSDLEQYIKAFKIGRAGGHDSWDIWMSAQFTNVKRTPGTKRKFDLEIENLGRVEVRTFNQRGSDLFPSHLKGTGRGKNSDGTAKTPEEKREIYRNHFKTRAGVILIDVNDFPDVYIRFIPSDSVIKSYPNGKIRLGTRPGLFEIGL